MSSSHSPEDHLNIWCFNIWLVPQRAGVFVCSLSIGEIIWCQWSRKSPERLPQSVTRLHLLILYSLTSLLTKSHLWRWSLCRISALTFSYYPVFTENRNIIVHGAECDNDSDRWRFRCRVFQTVSFLTFLLQLAVSVLQTCRSDRHPGHVTTGR